MYTLVITEHPGRFLGLGTKWRSGAVPLNLPSVSFAYSGSVAGLDARKKE